MGNLATVQAIYEAFGKGDGPGILAHIAPDCAWESWADNTAQKQGVPYMQPGTGPEGTGAFLGCIAGELDLHEFSVLDIMPGERQVAVEFVIEFTVKATGKRLRDEEMHLWTFNDDGKVSRLRHYTDTAKHIEASRL